MYLVPPHTLLKVFIILLDHPAYCICTILSPINEVCSPTTTPQQQQQTTDDNNNRFIIHCHYYHTFNRPAQTSSTTSGIDTGGRFPVRHILHRGFNYGKRMENIWRMSTRPRYILGAATVHHVCVRLHVRRENRGVNHAHGQ